MDSLSRLLAFAIALKLGVHQIKHYSSEYAINLLPCYQLLAQQDSLHLVNDAIEQFGVAPHLYLIGTRPRISMKKGSGQIDGNAVKCELEVHQQDERIEVPCDLQWERLPDGTELKCEYPYTKFVLETPDGNSRLASKWSLMLQGIQPMSPHLNFDVLYVGQAFGEDGDRNAAERLASHETLQKIYAEAIQKKPDKEVWLNLIAFQPPMQIVMFDGRHKGPTDEPEGHDEKFAELDMSWAHQICFAEAAMIRYFQPEYNKIFKNSFPSQSHVSYAECYDLDLNSVSVEFNTESLNCTFSSLSVEPSGLHMIQYALHDRKERVAMFEPFEKTE